MAIVLPDWQEMDLARYTAQIGQWISGEGVNGYFVSGLDVEIEWLGKALGDHPRILNPSREALRRVRKPQVSCAAALEMNVPDWLPCRGSVGGFPLAVVRRKTYPSGRMMQNIGLQGERAGFRCVSLPPCIGRAG